MRRVHVKKELLAGLVMLLLSTPLSATLRSGNYDTTYSGIQSSYNGGCYSDGKRLVIGHSDWDGVNARVGIFNYIPNANVSADSADVKITGFNGVGWPVYYSPNVCIVGNKLLAGDSDPAIGYHVKIWNSIPTSNTVASSCNYKITGFANPVTSIRTDGTKFCLRSAKSGGQGTIWIWNSVPETNIDTSSPDAYSTDGYSVSCAWFGGSGKFYVLHTQTANDVYYYSIFNSVPSSPFSLSSNTARITISSYWTYGSDLIELRNILYIVATTRYDTGKCHEYIWTNIPTTTNADTTNVSGNIILNENILKNFCDLHNLYLWQGIAGNKICVYINDYDTFTVTGTNLMPTSIDQRHLDQPVEKIKITCTPGRTTLSSIKLNLTGNCDDVDVSAVKLYEDVNNDNSCSQGIDVLLGSGTFSNKTATISNLSLVTDAGEKNLIVAYDISANSVLGHTVGVNVEYLIFEKYMHEVPSSMSSGLSTIVSAVIPDWNAQLNIKYTNQGTSDTMFSIYLYWDSATGGAPPLVYKITHIIDDSDSEVLSESETYRAINNLDSAKKHKFSVRVVDLFGNQTQESNTVYDDVPPQWSGVFKIQDASVKASDGNWNYKIKIILEPAVDNTSKSILYEISVKQQGGEWEIKETTWENSIDITGMSGAVSVRIRARDSAGNFTDYTSVKKIRLNPFLIISEENVIDIKGGTFTLEELEGEKVLIEIPEGALEKPHTVVIEKITESEYTYKFRLYNAQNIEKKANFKKPVTIKFFYNVDRVTRLGYQEDNLHVLHHDGIRWRKVGGEINRTERSVKVSVYTFSKYKLSGEKETTKDLYVSSLFVTPNDDGINDVLILTPNWNFTGDLSVKIFDTDGKILYQYSGPDKTVKWDCRTGGMSLAEAGVYVYSSKVEDKTFNGTFVISK